MRRLNLKWLIALIGAFGLMAAGCGDDTTSGQSAGVGEACEQSSDCADGLTCVDGVCEADTDDDGILDDVDNCPETPNPDQADADGDGIGDACDDTDDSGGEEGDDCETNADCDGSLVCIDDVCASDADGDGVADGDDNCPNTPNPDQTDADGDGVGDACTEGGGGVGDDCQGSVDCADGLVCIDDVCASDRDGDGIPDPDDNCPDTPNSNQNDLDGDGTGDVCDDDTDGDGILDDGDGSGDPDDNPCEDGETTDCDDNCPLVQNPDQSDIDQDGTGDLCDSDTTRRDGRPSDDTCSFDFTTNELDPQVEWSLTITDNDPYPDRDQVMTTPMVANLNDDNGDGVVDENDIPDVIFTTFATNGNTDGWDNLEYGVLRAASGDGSGLLWSVGFDELAQLSEISSTYTAGGSPDLERLGIQPAGSVAVGDIDNDGSVEIVAGLWHDQTATGGMVAINADGTPEWVTSATDTDGVKLPHQFESWWGGPSIANIDGLGTPEIVIGSAVFDSNGELLFDGADIDTLTGYPGKGINWADGTPGTYGGTLGAVADLDAATDPDSGQFTMEIVTGTTAYTHDGDVFWEADASLPDGFVALADFDGDVSPEVVVSANGTVRIQDGLTGEVVWGPVAIEGYDGGADGGRIGPPTIADFDGDGSTGDPDLEIGVAGANQYVALDIDASTFDASNPPVPSFDSVKLWAAPTQDDSSNMTGSSLFDFQGDGTAEVVYADETTLWVFDGTTGAERFSQPNSSFTALEYPIVADVDNDGNAEIVVGSNDFECGDQLDCAGNSSTGIKVLGDRNDSWVATRRIWNQHTYHITNVDEDGAIPDQELDNWYVSNTYRLNELTEIPPQAAPDLIGEDPQVAGESCDVDVQLWVTNAGAVRVGSGLPVSFYAVDSNGDRIFLDGARTQMPLEPGESERVDAQLTLPSDGTWEIEAVVDDSNGTGESTENECNEDNNSVIVGDGLVCD